MAAPENTSAVPPAAAVAVAVAADAAVDEKWAKSEAKRQLTQDIMSGVVTPEMEPKVVHESREVYKPWPLHRFGPNLKNLREALGRDFHRMMNDCVYYGHDVANLYEHRQKYPLDETPWHLSPAKDLLLEDINNGEHNRMIPSALWCTREEYLAFTLDIFRGHLYQELKKRDRIASNIRYGKKKYRVNTEDSSADEAMPMIEAYAKSAPKKKKPKKLTPIAEEKKRKKEEDYHNLPETRKARVTRKA